jgi:hypothetical protein
MDDGNNANHRMHVLKGTDDVDPTQPFEVSRNFGSAKLQAKGVFSSSVQLHLRTTTGLLMEPS